MTDINVEVLEAYLLKEKLEKKVNTHPHKVSTKLENEFGFDFVGEGATRLVLKKNGIVYKFGGIPYNRVEYYVYNGCKNSVVENILAKSYNISNMGLVLEQEYIPKRIAQRDLYHWWDIQNSLETALDFRHLGSIRDLHSDNMMATDNGLVKLIDYSYGMKRPSSVIEMKSLQKEIASKTERWRRKFSFKVKDNFLLLEIGKTKKEAEIAIS